MREERTELVVIGSGPAGMAAALAAGRAGLHEVTVIERHVELGGILRQCVHNGFGLQYYKEEMTGPEYAERLQGELLAQPGIRVELDTMVTALTPARRITTMSSRRGLINWQAGAVVLAMGCRERPRGAINLPGTRPAGIFTAGTAQHLINLQGLLPGRTAVIVGSGDIGLIMARRLLWEGVKVRAVVELLPYPGGLTRNLVQCLEDFGIPLYLGHTISEIRGRERVEGVTIAPAAGGPSFDLACDTLILSVGLIPETELARQAGCVLDPATGGAVVDSLLQTSIPGIFSCGNVLHVHDLADAASVEGELAGRAAAAYAGKKTESRAKVPVAIEGNLRSVVPQFIDPGQANTIHLRVKLPGDRAVLRIGGKIAGRYRRVKPAEGITVELPAGCYAADDLGRLVVALASEVEAANPARAEAAAASAGGERALTCIVCPLSCRIRVWQEGGELRMEGAACKRGEEYARREVLAPVRMVTGTAAVAGGGLLPVRSQGPVPRGSVEAAVEEIRRAVVRGPVRMGEVVIPDLAGTGIAAVASRSWGKKER